MNGTTYQGRVQLCNESEWKSVCVFGWQAEEAVVACRQLGFSGDLNR